MSRSAGQVLEDRHPSSMLRPDGATSGPHSGSRAPRAAAGEVLLALEAVVPLLVGGRRLADRRRRSLVVPALVLIAAFAIASELTSVETGTKITISGSFLALILASVLLGPGPGGARRRARDHRQLAALRVGAHVFVHNLANYALCPLLGGLFFHATASLAHVGRSDVGLLPARVRHLPRHAGPELPARRRLSLLSGPQLAVAASAGDAVPVPLGRAVLGAADADGRVLANRLGTIGLALFGLVLGDLPVPGRRAADLQAAQREAAADRHHRRADRPGQPRALPRGRRGADRRAPGPDGALRGDADGPRPLQGGQRHARPPLRRRAAARPRPAAGRARSAPSGLVARLGGDEFGILPADRVGDPACSRRSSPG